MIAALGAGAVGFDRRRCRAAADLGGGKYQGDGRPLAGHAGDRPFAFHHFRPRPRQGQAQPDAFMGSAHDVLDLGEGLENTRQVFRLNTDPPVPDPNDHVAVMVERRGDLRHAVVGRELDRVIDEVEQDLFQTQRIRPQRRQVLWH